MKNWLQKNWVFFSGLLGSIAVTLQQFMTNGPTEWKVIGFAVFMAVLSYLANQWKGQGLSVTGIIGVLAYTFISVYNTGSFNWQQFILSAIVAILAAVAPKPKEIQQ